MFETVPLACRSSRYFLGVHVEHIEPMFELTWMPVLAAVSACLQASNDVRLIKMCMNIVKDGIRIACIFDMETEKEALVGTLYKFGSLRNVHAISKENLLIFKSLIQMAYMCGCYFQASWVEVLRSISELEGAKLVRNFPARSHRVVDGKHSRSPVRSSWERR
jgi:brefeldin A-inhibited guanine nucleotide-exchange protein